jgi:hypothetical protein
MPDILGCRDVFRQGIGAKDITAYHFVRIGRNLPFMGGICAIVGEEVLDHDGLRP